MTVFDYTFQAELAHKAHLEFKTYIAATLERTLKSRDRQTRLEYVAFQKSPRYQELLNAFWSSTEAAFPPGFDEDFKNLRTRTDLKALEMAISFLEADPYFFRSGYTKEKLLRFVRGYKLTVYDSDRLRQVVLNVVDRHYCREFREYCRLATKIATLEFRAELQKRLDHTDPNVGKRAQWVVNYLPPIYR